MNPIKMISLTVGDAKWLAEKDLNVSLFVRRAIKVARDADNTNIEDLVSRLHRINEKMRELVGAYETDKTAATAGKTNSIGAR